MKSHSWFHYGVDIFQSFWKFEILQKHSWETSSSSSSSANTTPSKDSDASSSASPRRKHRHAGSKAEPESCKSPPPRKKVSYIYPTYMVYGWCGTGTAMPPFLFYKDRYKKKYDSTRNEEGYNSVWKSKRKLHYNIFLRCIKICCKHSKRTYARKEAAGVQRWDEMKSSSRGYVVRAAAQQQGEIGARRVASWYSMLYIFYEEPGLITLDS